MDFAQSLDYLYGLQRFGIKLGLDNIRELLNRLGHPERGYGVIHVAGSNGKGSVCAGLASILLAAGYRVGLYTSPHLHSFTERIQVSGRFISEEQVVQYTEELRRLSADVPATFFEFTTAMALLHFDCEGVDFAILEVGLGGRLDATNAVTAPLLSVITPVCLDHTAHLGAELGLIAAEKGGIIKPGVPLVLGRQEPEALAVLLELARQQQAPVRLLGRDFCCSVTRERFSYAGTCLREDGLLPGLAGAHQVENLSLAIAAAEVLKERGVAIEGAHVRSGVEQVRWPGRLEWWRQGRKVLLDGAHNAGGARVLADYLKGLETVRIRWVVGIKEDKDYREILAPVLPLTHMLYCTVPPVDAAVPAEELARVGGQECPARVFASCQEALKAALSDCDTDEIVLVAGSLFLVAAARAYLSDLENVLSASL